MGFPEMLAVSHVSDDVYAATPEGSGLLFGGCSLALALTAANQTVPPEISPKSLHVCFFRPGEWGSESTLEVEKWSDGRSFATRQVTLSQGGRAIAALVASFYLPGEGGDWQASFPDVPGPEELSPATVHLPQQVMEIRPVKVGSPFTLHESLHPYWARSSSPIGEDGTMHCAAVAFMSDYMVIFSMHDAGQVIPATTNIRTVTHSVWFHRKVDAERWHLFVSDPSSFANGRGFALGSVYSDTASLVASFAQEVIIQA